MSSSTTPPWWATAAVACGAGALITFLLRREYERGESAAAAAAAASASAARRGRSMHYCSEDEEYDDFDARPRGSALGRSGGGKNGRKPRRFSGRYSSPPQDSFSSPSYASDSPAGRKLRGVRRESDADEVAQKLGEAMNEEVGVGSWEGFSMEDAQKHSEALGVQHNLKTPRDVLADLQRGNARFWQGVATRPEMSAFERRALILQQYPSVAILGCSDARVPVEIVFDQVGDGERGRGRRRVGEGREGREKQGGGGLRTCTIPWHPILREGGGRRVEKREKREEKSSCVCCCMCGSIHTVMCGLLYL